MELSVRTVEAFHALSVVLPIYDEEARHFVRATTKADIATIIPYFFMDLSRLAIKHPGKFNAYLDYICLLYTSPSPRDRTRSRMPSSA